MYGLESSASSPGGLTHRSDERADPAGVTALRVKGTHPLAHPGGAFVVGELRLVGEQIVGGVYQGPLIFRPGVVHECDIPRSPTDVRTTTFRGRAID